MKNTLDGLTIGRIVHYVNDTGRGTVDHYAAIVVDVLNETGHINLCVFTPWGDAQPRKGTDFDASCKAGTWHWPEAA